MHQIDRLQNRIFSMRNPTVAGLDTKLEYLPDIEIRDVKTFEAAADAIYRYHCSLVDALCDIVPAVKLQIAYYEMYGLPGLRCFQKTAAYAADKGMCVIADIKRGDIGATAQAYANAYLGQTTMGEQGMRAFVCDLATVNPYFGTDGIQPFIEACERTGNGFFVLVKTSNPSSGQLQDLVVDGQPIYERVGAMVGQWGESTMGDSGYSLVGAVVSATYPEQGRRLRQALPHTFFLVPGYGAQGATGHDLVGCFDAQGGGAVVNASRSLLCAWKKQPGMSAPDAARQEALRMRDDIQSCLGRNNA